MGKYHRGVGDDIIKAELWFRASQAGFLEYFRKEWTVQMLQVAECRLRSYLSIRKRTAARSIGLH